MTSHPVPDHLAGPARRACREFTGADPTFVVQAPGRVNLIGEHTDYNGGWVLPMAIDRWTVIAGRPRADRTVRVRSGARPDPVGFDLDALQPGAVADWGAYVAGMADSLAADGWRLGGWEGAVVSDVPVGAGLSSSAALELAVAAAFAARDPQGWDPRALALAGQRTEHRWAGTGCGLMDPWVIAAARPGHALLLDCRNLSARHVPIPRSLALVILDTGCRRRLATSEYNRRREECAAAARAAGVESLRDLDADGLEVLRDRVPPAVFRRARHVVDENTRVLGAVTALETGDLPALGRAMDASHRSLRDDYEVSGPELDRLVDAARSAPGCVGARLTGAGFGGCAVAAVLRDRVDAFLRAMADVSAVPGGPPAGVWPVRPVGGAGPVVPASPTPKSDWPGAGSER